MQSSVLFVAFAVLAPGAKEAPKKAETPEIVGEWECEKCVVSGKEIPVSKSGFHFKANGECAMLKNGKAADTGTFKLDTAKTPMQIDLVLDVNGGKETVPGIFKVVGDKLLINFADQKDGERPKDFDSIAGTKQMSMTLKRLSAKK